MAAMERQRSCYVGHATPGIDVSKYQGDIDWDEVAASQAVSFVYIRVGDGLHVDQKFARNWSEAGRVGLHRGFYHFFRGGLDGAAQAKMAIDAVKAAGGLKRDDLPPALDFECPTFHSGPLSETRSCRGTPIDPDKVLRETRAYLSAIKNRLYRKPIIYTGGAWVTWAGMYPQHADALSDYDLWRPQYNTTGCVIVPPGFSAPIIQQWTSSGSVPGIRGNVDRNAFRGSYPELLSFAKRSKHYPWWLGVGVAGTVALGGMLWYYSAYRGKDPAWM